MMYKYLLESADGVQFYGITALVLFFLIFSGGFISSLLKNKKDLDTVAQLPLEDD